MHKSSRFVHSTLNPYITVLHTFLTTMLKDRHTLAVLERAIPWTELTAFPNTAPQLQKLQSERREGGCC